MERETEREVRKYPNATLITTKSGTKVIVVGSYQRRNRARRVKYGDKFVDVYNDNFTHKEQRRIGNVRYDLNNRMVNPVNIAECGKSTSPNAKKLNPGHGGIAQIHIRDSKKKNETTIVHELIHAKSHFDNIPSSKQNEKKIDFETVGRVTRRGLMQNTSGYYWSRKYGNKHMPTYKKVGAERDRISSRGIRHDRILLTGSLDNRLKGNPLNKRVNERFRQSFFFKKDMSLFRDNNE
jgi:hypothetical protein